MANAQTKETLQPDERGFGALVERVSNMTQALERMANETSQMRGVVESIRLDQIRLQAEINLVSSQLQSTARELREEIDRNSIKKVWANMTSIVAGLVSIVALLVSLGVIKSGA
jgi:septation ring formation regulator EzrA